MKRRNFLRAGAGIGSAMSLGLGASMLRFGNAEAAGEDYKALVCVDLNGGNDGMNMIVPFDDIHYNEYAALRTTLALPKSGLSQLSNEYAMHGGMAALQGAWQDRAMAVMHNIGTLSRPLTKDQFWNWWGVQDNTYVPDGIQSHPGSSALWQTGGSDDSWQTSVNVGSTPSGWGARALDQLAGRSLISVGGNAILGVSPTSVPLTVPGSPANPGYITGHYSLPDHADAARFSAMQQLAQIGANESHPLYRAVAAGQQQDITYNAQLGPVISAPMSDTASNPEFASLFAAAEAVDSYNIVNQLFQIAKMIKARRLLGGNRHIFYASMPCYDTHNNQAGQQAAFLAALGAGLAALYAGMKNLGLEQNVTAFTVSDFGRTFAANGSAGTDHGWGNEHIVVGGAVDGGKFYGSYPRLILGGPDDMYQAGQWVPTLGHDQYAATLLKWFDPRIDVGAVFANLKNFSSPTLGFMKSA